LFFVSFQRKLESMNIASQAAPGCRIKPGMTTRLLPLLVLAGCTATQPYAPIRDVHYSALGQNPFWMLAIGDDRVVLTFGPAPGGRPGELRSHSYPRVLPRTEDGVRRWQSGEGTAVIDVEARPGPCTGSRGARYEDEVRIRLSGRELSGCGGRRLSRGDR
jgi:uncharacterized membrane protein